MSELKPCPFCGGEAAYTQILGNYGRVYCFTCDGGIREGRSKDGVIHNWNNRPIEDALQAENEWLKEELQQEKTRSQLNLEAEERRMLNITYYCAEIDRLNARIAELESAQRWIPVSERLPEVYRDEDGEFIPFLVCENDKDFPYRALYDGLNWGDGMFVADVTHWMPLPKLPEVQE